MSKRFFVGPAALSGDLDSVHSSPTVNGSNDRETDGYTAVDYIR